MVNINQQNEEVAVNKMDWTEGYQEEDMFENEDPNFDDELNFDFSDDDLDSFEDNFDETEAEQEEQQDLEEINEEKQDAPEQQQDEQEAPEELEEAQFGLTSLTPSVATVMNRIPEAGVASVVKAGKNGHRLSVAEEVHSKLKSPEKLQVGFIENNFVLAEYLSDECTSYSLKKQGAKHIIYSKELVEQITEHCGLDFSNRTSITFHKATYRKLNNQIIAVISMN